MVTMHHKSHFYFSSVKAGTFEADGWPDAAAYSCSKMAATLLARAMQEEFNKTPERDIVVNAVSHSNAT